MAKAPIVKNYKISANGILHATDDNHVAIEVEDTGELVMLSNLLEDFMNKTVKLSVTYDEDYE